MERLTSSRETALCGVTSSSKSKLPPPNHSFDSRRLPGAIGDRASSPSWGFSAYTVWNSSRLNCMMLFALPAFISATAGGSQELTFIMALLTLIPLGSMCGFLAEQAALHTNETIGGLLNVSFSNSSELLVGYFALQENLFRVVKAALLGSVLSNMLLVLGCSLMAAGIKFGTQKFRNKAAVTSISLLLILVMASCFTIIISSENQVANPSAAGLEHSRIASLILVCVYAAFVQFQLSAMQSDSESPRRRAVQAGDEESIRASLESSDEEKPLLTLCQSICWLALSAVLTCYYSDALVDSTEGAAKQLGVPDVFVGFVMIPIIGNVPELVSSLTVALGGSVGISVSICIGSVTQVSLGVLPSIILLAWVMDKPFCLDLQIVETVALAFALLVTGFVLISGTTNRIKGILLVSAWVIIAHAFLVGVGMDTKKNGGDLEDKGGESSMDTGSSFAGGASFVAEGGIHNSHKH